MPELRRLPRPSDSATSTRPYVLLLLDDLGAWPTDLPLDGQRFSLFMVIDERDVAENGFAAWNAFADRAIKQGLAYFAAWGPDCERLHDVMDETLVEREVDPTAHLDNGWNTGKSHRLRGAHFDLQVKTPPGDRFVRLDAHPDALHFLGPLHALQRQERAGLAYFIVVHQGNERLRNSRSLHVRRPHAVHGDCAHLSVFIRESPHESRVECGGPRRRIVAIVVPWGLFAVDARVGRRAVPRAAGRESRVASRERRS